jgi:DNA-binding XRE family transcriptional regulator
MMLLHLLTQHRVNRYHGITSHITICNILYYQNNYFAIPLRNFENLIFCDMLFLKGGHHMKIIDNSECLIGFGEFIREGRERKHLYQSEVASQLGITQAYYSHIEQGKRNVDLVVAMRICQILDLDLKDYIHAYQQ